MSKALNRSGLLPRPSNAELLRIQTERLKRRGSPIVKQSLTVADKAQAKSYNPFARMNKTEARRAQELDAKLKTGAIRFWKYESVTLKLADGCRYTPDFMVIENDGEVVFEETKGRWRDDALVKIKVVAAQYPHFTFRAFQRDKNTGGWKVKDFTPITN